MTRVPARMSSVVLLSGGMDSATCLAIAARRGPVCALSVHYGQRHERELRAARALARFYGVARHDVVRLPIGPLLDSALTQPDRTLPHRPSAPGAPIPVSYVPARNTLLLALALGYAESRGARSIYVGVNAIDYSGTRTADRNTSVRSSGSRPSPRATGWRAGRFGFALRCSSSRRPRSSDSESASPSRGGSRGAATRAGPPVRSVRCVSFPSDRL